ncbi:MAG: sortase [Anaerolineales bacterium]
MKNQWFYKLLSALLVVMLAVAALPVKPAFAASDTFNTAGAGTWVAPTGVTSITVEVWGGGGRGGSFGGGGAEAVGGGGGGGAYSRSVLTVIPGNTYNLSVGAGSTTAAAGGDTWFINATTVMAKGGNSSTSGTGATGGDQAAGFGTTKFSGGAGANGSAAANYGGGGGSSAGTAAAGNTATNATGATAPAGGGAGGAGAAATGGGTVGTAPGGGGGGPYRAGGGGGQNGGNGANGRVVITYTASTPPVLAAIEGAALAYTENQAATAITATTTVADADSINLTGATIQITSNYQNGQDVLAFTNQLGITGTWTAATGTMALTGTTTVANYQTAIRAVTYQNTSDSPNTTTRTVSFTVSDGANSNTVTRNITVAAVNDGPVLAAIEGAALAYTENQAATAITATTTVADVDSANLTGATIQITGNYQNGQDVLAFTNQLGITGTWTAATGTMTLTGTTTVANYQTAIRAVTYQNTSDNPNALVRTVSYRVSDGTNSNIVTRNIIVTPVNDGPVLAAVEGAALAYTEGQAATAITTTTTVADVDSANLTGATIQITGNYQNGQDVLAFTNQLGITGTWTAATGTMTLTGTTTVANYQTAIRAVTYQNTSNNPNTTARTVSFSATDGTTGSNTVTRTINVSAVDTLPTAVLDAATVWEDSSANLIDVLSNDTDVDGGPKTVASVGVAAHGTVINNTTNVSYQPASNYCGPDSFTYTVNGGSSATVNVTITCQTTITASILASDKTYDNTTTAAFTCSLTGVVPPDVVTCSGGVATFDTEIVGTNKLVTAIGLGLSGADAFKYQLASTSATDTADITQRTLNVTATGVNKLYDGTTTATVTLSDDRILGDDLTLNYTSADFVDPNVNNNITINVSGIAITGGLDSGNYLLGNTTATTTANIGIVSQTITVTTHAPATASNGSSFNVAATADSGLFVSITALPGSSCTVVDNGDGTAGVTMTSGTGTCNVSYTQAGNGNYSAAAPVQEDVTAQEGPSFTSVNNATFDVGFVGSFTITATGNPSTMVISEAGALPSGVSLVDNGNGTATLSGTPAIGTNGTYSLVLTANNGVAPNGTQNFTLTIKNGPTISANGINSVPDTGDANVSENESILDTLGITTLTVQFSQDVYDDPTDTLDYGHDVTNPANYILVRSTDGTYATVDCKGGVLPPDVAISVDSVTYSNGGGSGPYVATLSINGGFPLNVVGFYRLYVCGTTSIVDANNRGLELAGNGTTPGTDFQRNFRVATVVAGGGGGGGGSSSSKTAITSSFLIPVTGFAPNQVTTLPAQPADINYTSMGQMTIEIPALGIKYPIVGASITNRTWDLTWLKDSVAYLEGSAYPTTAGNTVLTAHVQDANKNLGPFSDIKGMELGQKVYIHVNGQIYVYQVQENRKISASNITEMFKHEEDSWLTLVTCEDFNAKTGLYTSRRMVRAVLISVIFEK